MAIDIQAAGPIINGVVVALAAFFVQRAVKRSDDATEAGNRRVEKKMDELAQQVSNLGQRHGAFDVRIAELSIRITHVEAEVVALQHCIPRRRRTDDPGDGP